MVLKCINCPRDAEYIFCGYSYCKEHKEKHEKRYDAVMEDMTNKGVLAQPE